jgi:hypothetical protein
MWAYQTQKLTGGIGAGSTIIQGNPTDYGKLTEPLGITAIVITVGSFLANLSIEIKLISLAIAIFCIAYSLINRYSNQQKNRDDPLIQSVYPPKPGA